MKYSKAPETVPNGMNDSTQPGQCPAWLDYTQGSTRPYLAEQTYREAIKLFDKNGMAMNAATICVALARFFWEQGRMDEAEAVLKQNIVYLIRHWGPAITMCSQQRRS
ncbi:MAG: tetratricopeptide repeat protein [Candidatus Obscuribacter sp.]|nr:tetratricopeptide repeat protein [Candidatus Obscuribacter sp.]